MRYLVTAAAAALMSAGAAQAAVYKYDVTMERTALRLPVLQADGPGHVDVSIPGITCENYLDDSSMPKHYCSGTGNFTSDRMGLETLNEYDRFIEVSFSLNATDQRQARRDPIPCTGPNFICRSLKTTEQKSILSTEDSFEIIPYEENLAFDFTNEGFYLQTDEGFSFTIGGANFASPGYAGISLSYKVVDLQVAPVPLPASFPLLALGIGGIFALRRRR